MDKILEQLYDRAIKGDDRASDLYEQMEGMGPEQLASFVAVNDSTLQDVLGINRSIMDEDLKEEDKALMDAYYSLRNTGVTNYIKPVGTERADVYGRPMHSLDEYMQAFGVAPVDNLAISDDDRAYFTNPEHPNYWKNRPENERRAVANKMGFQDLRELDEYLDRASQDFQDRNRAEGWDANNKVMPMEFLTSSAAGLILPRAKEAKLEGRDPAIRDYAGDIAENALSLVPGIGTTKILSKVPKVGGKIAGTTAAQVAGTAMDQFAQPLASQAIDAGILYNPDVLGKPGDELNLRSQFSLPTVAAQGAGIAGVKGLAKQGAGMVKNFAETRYGNTSGGQIAKNLVTPIENINEKTDDLIARRQAVLDRKAELAKNAEQVQFAKKLDIANANPGRVEDLYSADDFRILNEEAERIARSEPERRANNMADAVQASNDQASKRMRDLNDALVAEEEKLEKMEQDKIFRRVDPEELDEQRARVEELSERFNDLNRDMTEGYLKDAATIDEDRMAEMAKSYMDANERGASDIVQLPDGKFIYSNRLLSPRAPEVRYRSNDFVDPDIAPGMSPMPDDGGYVIEYPGSNYRMPVPEGTRPVLFAYDGKHTGRLSPLTREDFVPNGGFAVPRNSAVIGRIQADDLLRRKLNPKATFRSEATRDVIANNAFNAMAREGVGGLSQSTGVDEKRERALWNSMVGKLRPMVTDPKLPVSERRKYADAVMNVMQYGLDGLPEEVFMQSPTVYKEIAGRLGLRGWKHFSETSPQPTTSYSSAY